MQRETSFNCAAAGFRMPAEWEPMAACWLGWPVLENREELWGSHYEQVCREFALLAQCIAKYQRCIVTAYEPLAEQARELCGPTVEVVAAAAEDNWLRDCGPIFLNGPDKQQLALVYEFNAWGNKYSPYDGCKQIGGDIARLAGVEIVRSEMVLEGGSFYVDGEGTLLTTESCLLNKNRNPNMSKAQIEVELIRTLGVEKIIWLPGNPAETETDGHIDGIASFTAPGKILFNSADADMGEYYDCMMANRRVLEEATDAKGRRFEIIDLPTPRTDTTLNPERGNERDCDIYSNYILVNGAVISTAFDVPQDAIARKAFEQSFPGRVVELLPVTTIGLGGGSLHCSTQQQPAKA